MISSRAIHCYTTRCTSFIHTHNIFIRTHTPVHFRHFSPTHSSHMSSNFQHIHHNIITCHHCVVCHSSSINMRNAEDRKFTHTNIPAHFPNISTTHPSRFRYVPSLRSTSPRLLRRKIPPETRAVSILIVLPVYIYVCSCIHVYIYM